MRHLIACCLLIGIVVNALPAAAAKRIALVIGNGAYQNTDPLPNPANDGREVAAALRRLGFDVIEGTDQDKAGMQTLLRQFSGQLQGADASLFFYAGHGLQVQRRNWMVPVDAALQSEIDLPFEGVAVDTVLDLMEETTPLRLVFLDACRDNPLARRLSRSAPSRSLEVGRGLARMNNRIGTLIAFATEPDQVALDGDGDNSPFTEALLEHIETPGLEVRQMLSRVRASVINHTDGQQLPLDTSALVEDFYFTTPAPAPAEPAPTAPGVASTEHLFWQSIQASTDPNDFRAYLESYPDGSFAPLARNRLAALSAAPQTEVAALTPPTEAPAATPPPEAPPPAATLPAPPVPEAVPETVEVEVEPLDTTVVATRNVNVRGVPNTDGDPLDVVAQGAEVAVVGKVVDSNWYQIRRPDGSEAYVWAPLFASRESLAAAAAPPPAQAAQVPQPAEPAEPAAPAEPVQMAGVAPNVATAPGKAPMTRAGPVPAPHVDATALLQTLGERARNVNFRFNYQIQGDRGTEFVAFSRWEEVGPGDDAPSIVANAAGTRVQAASDTFGEAVMATEVTPEMFGVVMYSRAIHSGRATFMPVPISSSLSQWLFLGRHGARVEATSSMIVEGVQFDVAALSLNDGAPARSCLGFVAYQVSRRVDGFVCRPAGPAFDVAQASAVLGQMRVPRFIEP
jgi:Caspase domain/Bacterial SH3 domain